MKTRINSNGTLRGGELLAILAPYSVFFAYGSVV